MIKTRKKSGSRRIGKTKLERWDETEKNWRRKQGKRRDEKEDGRDFGCGARAYSGVAKAGRKNLSNCDRRAIEPNHIEYVTTSDIAPTYVSSPCYLNNELTLSALYQSSLWLKEEGNMSAIIRLGLEFGKVVTKKFSNLETCVEIGKSFWSLKKPINYKSKAGLFCFFVLNF